MLQAGDTFPTRLAALRIERFLGKGKSGYSYLVSGGTEPLVLKLMHAEAVPYYTFGANKVHLETQAYFRLCDLGVTMPPLLEWDEQRNYLLKPYVNAPTATEVIASGQLSWATVQELRQWSTRLRAAGHNLDWFPSNFVVMPGAVVYVDYEINPFMPEWSFEEWGIWYWANSEGMRRFMETGDVLGINRDAVSGKPRITPELRATAESWLT